MIDKDLIKKTMRDAILELCSPESDLWDALDAAIQKELEDSNCYLSFDSGRPSVLIGLGSGHAAKAFTPTISTETYGPGASAVQRADMIIQIRCINDFIAELLKAKQELINDLGKGYTE